MPLDAPRRFHIAQGRRSISDLDPRTFEHAIDAYKASPEYTGLAASTRSDYARYLETIRKAWGNLEVAGLLPAHVLTLRDRGQATPAATNALIRTLSSLISWSIPRDYRNDNPCEHVRKLPIGDSWRPWPRKMIDLVEKHGPSSMWHAVALALYTGQRQGDVLAMTRSKIKNGLIEVRQEKTGRCLVIPAHQKLLTVIETMKGDSVQLLTNTRGQPWTKCGFKASWKKDLKGPLAVIRDEGLVFHGLRKSAVVMLLEAGASEAQVALSPASRCRW